MKLYNNYSLRNHNSFGLDVSCLFFAEVENKNEIKELLSDNRFCNLNKLVLGSGSNILLTKNFDGLVITQISNSINILSEDDTHCLVNADAGVTWHELVMFCVNKNIGGIENLSLIPGKVGAAPIQNIGAYGQELKDVFHSLKGIHIDELNEVEMSNSDCQFGYRDSIFKRELRDKFIITEVTLRLDKNPKLNTNYWAIKEELSKSNKTDLTIKDISKIVCQIRRSKLPDPEVLGNAGSFFKNPEISMEQHYQLKKKFNDIPGFNVPSGKIKIPAGWLIERCGFKGKRFGNVGIHEKQALVVVNYGGGTPQQILELRNNVIAEVKSLFNIKLEEEVNII
jgi:UDP-N-acetylmuramate dehydrogenase